MADTQQRVSNRNLPQLHPDWIDGHAAGIVKALQKAGFESYLVGGCVRDLLLGLHPKDFDIATMAHPPQVKRLIHMAFVIGKRFRLVLVKRGEQQFEVATFRKELNPNDFPAEQYPDGPPSGDNVFGSPEEDARRRDFTINALFYDPVSGELIDYVSGLKDIESRQLRMIGDPEIRLAEDPIRILRAIRFSHKLGFALEPNLRVAMVRHAGELKKSVLPRRREELLKLLRLDNPSEVLVECHDLGVLGEVFPCINRMFENLEQQETFLALLDTYRTAVDNFADAAQLFAWLLAAIAETRNEVGAPIGDDELNAVMRDELGMYKFEQTLIFDIIKMQRTLERTGDIRRRGERRQGSLIRREGFALALRLALADCRLSSTDASFWLSLYEKARPEIESARKEKRGSARRRRPRRRRPGEAENRDREPFSETGADDEGDADDSGDDIDSGEAESTTQSETRDRLT